MGLQVFAAISWFCSIGLALDDNLLSEQDVANMRYVTSSQISPNGKFIAYSLAVQRDLATDENGSAFVELHVVDLDGNSRPFVTGSVNVSSVGWMPDGNAISYLSKRNGDENTSLYIIPIDGGESQKLVAYETSISSYAFSDDGSKVAFLAKEKEGKDEKAKQGQGL